MKRLPSLVFLWIVSCLLTAQEVYKIDGITVNNTVTGNWEGVNIPRAVPTTLYFLNNSVTSVNSAGYLLQAGDESPISTNNNLNGAIITGNRFTWKGTISSSILTHGLFNGYNINGIIKYNFLDNVPYGIILKSGTDAGQNMTFTSGGVSYNIVKNGHFALRLKGINGVKAYNNTFYSGDAAGWYLVLITKNMDRTIGAPSLGARFFNNIFYTKHKIPVIKIDVTETLKDFQCDYNIYYCEEGDHTPVFMIGNVEYSWEKWRALGYDAHSYVVNPNFKDFVSFVPVSRLDYGIDLGTDWKTGLSTSVLWKAGSAPATTNQNGKWQVGAIIYPEVVAAQPPVVTPPPTTTPPVVTPPPVISPPAVLTPPVVVNSPPVVVVNYPPETLSGFVGELDASGSYDVNNDNLSYTWMVPANIPVSSTATAKVKFLSPVVNTPQIIEFTLVISDGKTTQSKTIPVEIHPYKPELEVADVVKIEASSFQSPYNPNNILDGNTETMWSANGDEEWLIMELKELFNIQHVKVAFQPGQKKVSFFDILGSADREVWEPILTKSASCGFSGDLHVFDFPESKSILEFRFVKLVGRSNSADSWNYISEFKIFGYSYRNPESYSEQPAKIYPNPAKESVSVRIEDMTMKADFIRIVNLTGKVVYEDELDPEITDFQIPVDFRNGIYIVQMGSGGLTLFAQKLVVNI